LRDSKLGIPQNTDLNLFDGISWSGKDRKALYRFLWDEAETQGMGGMKKGNEVSNL
jgi:hypothetical protein